MARSVINSARTALSRKRVALRDYGFSLEGNTTNGRVDLPNLSICTNVAYTICFWVATKGKTSGSITNMNVFTEGELLGTNQNMQIYFDDSNVRRVRWRLQDRVNTTISMSTGNALTTGFYHIVCVQNSTTARYIYVNGILSGSNGSTMNITSVTNSTLFAQINSGSYIQFGDFRVNDVQFYNTNLSSIQISGLYYDNIIPSGLVARYLCNEGSGTTLTDSVSGNNGTIQNCTWSTLVPLKSRTAIPSGRTLSS